MGYRLNICRSSISNTDKTTASITTSATGYSQQSKLCIQKDALTAIFQLQKPNAFPKHYLATTHLLEVSPQPPARQEIHMFREGCFYSEIL